MGIPFPNKTEAMSRGVNTEKKQADGSTVHFFYWLNETPQWEKRQEKRDAVVVFKIGAWAHEIV